MSAIGELRDRIGVAARCPEHGDPGRSRGRDVDVVGIASTRPDDFQRQVEDGPLDGVGLHDQHVGAFGAQAVGELLALVEAQGHLFDPGVVYDVGDRPEGLEANASERRGHERNGSRSHCAILAHA